MITENNKLIAEFMGGVLSSVTNLINLPQTRGDAKIHSVKGTEVLPNGTYSVHRLSELEYHISWDWLVPVVERIESLGIVSFEKNLQEEGDYQALFTKGNDILICHYADNSIEATYKAVVEFIKQLK